MTAEAAATATTTTMYLSRRAHSFSLSLSPSLPLSFFFVARVSAKNQSAATRRAVRGSRLSYHSRRIRIRDFLTASDAAVPRFLLRFIAKSLRGGRRAPRLSLAFLSFSSCTSSLSSLPSCFLSLSLLFSFFFSFSISRNFPSGVPQTHTPVASGRRKTKTKMKPIGHQKIVCSFSLSNYLSFATRARV